MKENIFNYILIKFLKLPIDVSVRIKFAFPGKEISIEDDIFDFSKDFLVTLLIYKTFDYASSET